MTEPVIASKMANALFPDAQIGSALAGSIVASAVAKQGARDGGLWVGGKAELTATRLRFAANGLNKALHSGGESLQFDLPLAEVRHVRLRKAFITSIVDVETDTGTYSLRCWGADGFARAISSAVAAARA